MPTTTGQLDELRTRGRIAWMAERRGWSAVPDDVVDALRADGFAEVRREVTRRGRTRTPHGGLWQGLDARTGAVASAVWIQGGTEPAVVFIDIDGTPLEEAEG
jgi:hypothetical protein